MWTVLTILQNLLPVFWLPDRQCLHQRRTLTFFSFFSDFPNFLRRFFHAFHFHSTNMQLIISGLLLVGAAVARSVSDASRSVSTGASSSTKSRFHHATPTLAPTYSHNNNNTNTSVIDISTITVTSTEVRFKISYCFAPSFDWRLHLS